ncbi:hypothetical protein GV791_04250 [Nocardia cyriacigeorgica]|uniref:Uncharacterized protein n=1 Tax=Nocardia cyriacigeorgica TaxID=135487 RepID=A0A6P1CIN1_9NOCA|nr:hypothetical protein [Nocardia cyriacigeorgica]MBF6425589.1 hypothetical protein [Nocardia cyriacigeorgica]NEW31772.1 hypothetical protein [Nocardia cyriacigeorgica]
MFDHVHAADNVTRWTGLGVKLPKQLTEAIKTFEAIRYTEIGHAPGLDITKVTPDNAEAKIRELADQLTLSMNLVPVVGANGVSVLEEAKRRYTDAAARSVLGEAGAAVPGIIELLSPEFDKHSAAYADAVAKLPTDLTADSLVRAGGDAVIAYAEAQREASYLNGVSNWVAETRLLPGHSGAPEPALRILRPTSVVQLTKLDEATWKQANQTVRAIDPVLYAAVREGVQFGINTSREASQIRSSLAIRPQPFTTV